MPFDYLSNDLIEYIFILCIHDYNGNLFNLHKKLEYLLIINKNCEKIAKNLISLKFYELKSLYIDSFSYCKMDVDSIITIFNVPSLAV